MAGKENVKIINVQDLSFNDWEFILSGPLRGLTRDFIEQLGIKKLHDAFVIPVRYHGDIVEALLYRPNGIPKWQPYQTLSWRGLFNMDFIEQPRRYVFLMEGPKDCIYGMFNGLPCVSLISGCGSFNLDLSSLFSHIPFLFIAFDNDRAGMDGAMKVKKVIKRSVILDWSKSPWEEMKIEKADVADFFQAGHSGEELMAWALSNIPPEANKIMNNLRGKFNASFTPIPINS